MTWDENRKHANFKINQIDQVIKGLGLTEESEKKRCARASLTRKKILEQTMKVIPEFFKKTLRYVFPEPIVYSYLQLPDEEVRSFTGQVTKCIPVIPLARDVFLSRLKITEDYLKSDEYKKERQEFLISKELEVEEFLDKHLLIRRNFD